MLKRKKIICTVTNDLTYDRRMQRICTSLAREGYEVCLVGRRLPSSVPLPSFAFQTQRLFCFFKKGAFFYAEYNIRLFFYLFFKKFDAVCAVDLDTILAAYVAARGKRKPIIYDAHEYFTEVPEIVERPRIKAIWEKIANLTIPHLRYAYTVGFGLQQVFETRYGVPFGVVRNMPFAITETLQNADIQRVSAKYKLPKTNKKILLYQGALNDGRGIEESIEAMRQLDDAVLWLAGEGDLSQQLRAQVQRAGLDDRVHFLGFVLPEDLSVLTHLADVGLNLLQNKGLNYYYSLANKCFDYIQAEKPALHRSFPEYVHLNAQFEIGVLLDELRPESIVAALQTLLSNPLKYKELQENCRKAKTVFTWENESVELLDFYKKIFE